MKCQKCAKPATFHITDIVEKGKHREYHFCDEHARQHLAPPDESFESAPISDLAKKLVASAGASGSIREPSAADKQVCPICQITFLEFRNSGRLGCPYDYEVFRDDLMPLLENIHGETRHSGKVPRRAPRNTQQQTTMIQLRNELKRAVAAEDYESAARLRDKIKAIEIEQGR
jgi:protein arginine kinase activator